MCLSICNIATTIPLTIPVMQQKYKMHSKEQTITINLTGLKGRKAEKAFRIFHERYYDRFFRIAFYYLKKEEWAKEVVLDIFYKLWERRETLSEIDRFDNYCFILIKNASLNYLSKEDRREVNELEGLSDPSVTESSPEEHYLEEELLQAYVEALDQLPPRCREVFIGIREEKKSYAEVASELKISTKTVDAQLQKAVLRLKKIILSYLKENE